MHIALVHDVFHDPDGPARLSGLLERARAAGAELAVLPELPFDPWWPATREAADEAAEGPGGSRQVRMRELARRAGIALLGGVIFRDPTSERRHNRALLYDARGIEVATYDKLHLPSEEGFWESDHYEPGDEPPRRVDGCSLPLGLQICSDLNRPEGSHLLGAQGAEVLLAPRATPPGSYERWRLVITANAITSATFIVSVNRPRPEAGTPLGGPSLAVAPDGRVLIETTEPLSIVHLDRRELLEARHAYPGYLAVRSALYARGWSALAGRPPHCP